MSESEAVSTIAELADVTATYGGLWISITFAYLTVAYFIGKQLSRFQCILVTSLYFVTACLFGGAAMGHSHAFFLSLEESETIYRHVWIFSGNSDIWLTTGGIFLAGGTLVSLYFMYDIRSSGAKK